MTLLGFGGSASHSPPVSGTDRFNVRDWGAIGNGVADDTAAIQTAINAASVSGIATADLQGYVTAQTFLGGGTVYLPPGVYMVSGIVLGNRVTLQGDGLGSILRLKPNTLSPVVRNAYGANQVCVRDLRIDGNKYNQSAGVRTVTDGTMSAGSYTLTSATAAFTANDLYQPITVSGAGLLGANGNSHQPVFIQAVGSATSITITDKPSGAVSGATVTIGNWTGRTVSDGSATIDSYTLTSATAAFTQADVFRSLTVSGAGSSGGTLTTFIRSVESSNSATMADFAATTVASGATITIVPRQDGILFQNRPTSPKTTDRNSSEDYDGNFRVYNVLIINCRGDGLRSAGRGDHFLSNVKVYETDGNGFYFEQDLFATSCNAGQIGLCGFNLNGSGLKIEGCKAWYCGLIGGHTLGDGFQVNGGVQAKINGGEAQDNNGHGFTLLFASGAILTGCTADSNGSSFNQTGPQGSGVGYNLYNATGCVIDGSIAMDEYRNPTPQDAALMIRNGSARNTIRILSNVNKGYWQTNPFISTLSDTSLSSGNTIEINSQRGFQTIAYSATIVPDPYVGEHVSVGILTGNISISNPLCQNYKNQSSSVVTNTYGYPTQKTSPGHAGCTLKFYLTQDSSGSRSVSFDTAYKLPPGFSVNSAANSLTVITFVFDGTNWNCVSTSK